MYLFNEKSYHLCFSVLRDVVATCLLGQTGVSDHFCTFADLMSYTNHHAENVTAVYGINPVDCVFNTPDEVDRCTDLETFGALGASCVGPGFDPSNIPDICA
jgi:hypothetical protein